MANNGQILILRKNHIDLDRANPVITVTDPVATNTGQASTLFLRNRDNTSGWLTTASNDSADTEILVELFDFLDVDFIGLLKHNFKDFLVEWRDGGLNWNTFVNITANSLGTNLHQVDAPVSTDAIRLTIYNTQIVDADKEMRQLIITEKKYKFEGWPEIKKPVHSTDKRNNRMLSGKVNIVDKRGAFSVDIFIKLTSNENDLTAHENLYYEREGVLLLLSGSEEDQFITKRRGYRNEDIFLVRPVDEYTNPYVQGVYTAGIKVKVSLQEAVF